MVMFSGGVSALEAGSWKAGPAVQVEDANKRPHLLPKHVGTDDLGRHPATPTHGRAAEGAHRRPAGKHVYS